MQIVRNDKFVGGRVKLGNIFNFASMGLLVLGLVLSIVGQNLGPESIWVAYLALFGALILLSYGRTLTRRWGPNFRQDGALVAGLRGLDNRHTLFNYAAADLPDHVLVGPEGLYVLLPKTQSGKIRFDGGRWSRGSVAGGLLRNLAEGGIGNPITETRQAMGQLASYLKTYGSEELIKGLEGNPIIVFTNPGAQLEVRNAPVRVMQAKELKSIFRKAKQALEPEKVEELRQVLGREVTA